MHPYSTAHLGWRLPAPTRDRRPRIAVFAANPAGAIGWAGWDAGNGQDLLSWPSSGGSCVRLLAHFTKTKGAVAEVKVVEELVSSYST
jgi:hypothetical protein